MTNYSRGAAFERKVKKVYEEKGYTVVRAAGSKGPIDLVAIYDPKWACQECGMVETTFIQCKLQKPTKAEREKAKATGLPILFVWPDGEEWI